MRWRDRVIAMSVLLPVLAASAIAAETEDDADGTDSFSVMMKGGSDPGDGTEIVAFVGEQIAYESMEFDCGEGCWVFDSWHKARYRISEWIHGVPQGPELEFTVAEHAVVVPMGHARHALVFVERLDDGWSLVKYQQVPVYPTADGGFASCGPLGDDADRRGDADFAGYPPMEDIAFAPALVVDDARRLSPHGWGELHDPRWHAIVGDEVVCRRGVPVDRIARFMANDHPTLKAALPTLAGGE